ncbi:MAG: hypothetical protein WC992_06355 [Acholeplasmataceae bacterium]
MDDCIEKLCDALGADLAAPTRWVSFEDYCCMQGFTAQRGRRHLARAGLGRATVAGKLMVRISGFGARVLRRKKAAIVRGEVQREERYMTYRTPPGLKLGRLYRLRPDLIRSAGSAQEVFVIPVMAWNNGGSRGERWFVLCGTNQMSLERFLETYELAPEVTDD